MSKIFLFFCLFLIAGLGFSALSYDCKFDNVCSLENLEVSGLGMVENCRQKNKKFVSCVISKVKISNKVFYSKDGSTEQGSIVNNKGYRDYRGKLLVEFYGNQRYKFGQIIRFEGVVEIAQNFSDFDYRAYLRKQGIFAVIKNSKNELIMKNEKGDFFLSKTDKLKRFSIKIKNLIAEKIDFLFGGNRGLIKALLIGEKDELKEKFALGTRKIGIAHLIAISGMHIAIISNLINEFFAFLPIERKKVFVLIHLILSFFVLMIGMPASALRALIMSFMLGFSRLIGRKSDQNLLLVFSALIILIFNPMYLFFDLGFQLSFCAVWGLINLTALIKNIFSKIKLDFNWAKESDKYKSLFVVREKIWEVIYSSIAAQLATLPLCYYFFGYIPFISLIANVLIFWIVFPIIFLGILAIGFSFFSEFLAKIFAFFCDLGLIYVKEITFYLSEFGFTGINFGHKNFSYFLFFAFLIILFFIVFGKLEISNKKIC
ncbi:MAG: DUF4131 domain-containing protein [Candidatus Moranbacteria bacterium]|nr:DUF4131 domain-containing protein [Candidatus Moranbacteria bacterium]